MYTYCSATLHEVVKSLAGPLAIDYLYLYVPGPSAADARYDSGRDNSEIDLGKIDGVFAIRANVDALPVPALTAIW